MFTKMKSRCCLRASAPQPGQPLLLEFFVQPDLFDSVKPSGKCRRDEQTRETSAKHQGNSLSLRRMVGMTDSHPSSDPSWDNAVALIEHFERSVRAGAAADSLDDLVVRLRSTAGAQSVSLITADTERSITIARSGVTIQVALDQQDPKRLVTTRVLAPDTTLNLDLRFETPLAWASRQHLRELCEALLDLAAGVYLQAQVDQLKQQLATQHDRDQWIESLYEGQSLHDSFARIANSLAHKISVDRVSLLRMDQLRAELIASSNQATIDRRASQVRLLEEVVAESVSGQNQFTYPEGSTKSVSSTVKAYIDQSGCQQIHLEVVPQANVVIALERFTTTADSKPLEALIAPFRQPMYHAIGVASHRDRVEWSQFAGLLTNAVRQTKTVYLLAGCCVVLLGVMLIQIPLKIPVDGKVIAAKSHRIYAPAEGIVSEVLVNDGDLVPSGLPLVQLRSPALDLQQRTIEAALATTMTRLDALKVSREERQPTHSADEKVLQSEITGLESQLELIRQRQSELLVTSPIAGRVDGWELRTDLISRPVAVGQYLLSVVADADDWKVQLSVPDQNVGYLLRQQRLDRCNVAFRLRSDATVMHHSAIESIADSAQIDASGKSVVHATMPFPTDVATQVREGATVIAQVDCGNRPVGFVWLRGLIEWWRSTSWF